MTAPLLLVPMVWYRREDYLRIRALCSDGAQMAATFDQWLEKAQHGFEHLTAQGKLVEKIEIDVDVFVDWCRRKSLNIDARARIEFVSEICARKHGHGEQ